MNLKEQALKGFLWMFTGSGIQSVMQFIVLIVLARLLDPRIFGVVSTGLVIISFAKILSTLGLGPALVQKRNIESKHIGTAYFSSLVLALFFSAIVYFSSEIIAEFFSMKELTAIMKVLTIILIFQGIAIVSESLIQRDLKFNILVRIQIVSYTSYAVVGIAFALLNLGVWALVFAQLSQIFIKMILSLRFQSYNFTFVFNTEAFKELLYFSGGYSIAKVSGELSNQGDNFIIGKFLGADALGLYSRAYQLMVTPANLIGKVLEKVLFPIMSKIQNQQEKIAYAYGEGIRLTTTAMLPGSIFLFVNAENIILLLFGEKWLGLITPFEILALSLLFRSSFKISDSLAKAKGAVYYRAVVKWIYTGMIFLFAYIGQFYGLQGVAAGVSFAILLNYVFMTILAVKLTKIKTSRLIEAHLGGFSVALVFWLLSIPFGEFVQSTFSHFITQLILFIAMFIVVFITSILIAPRLIIGPDGKEMLNSAKLFLRKKIKARI